MLRRIALPLLALAVALSPVASDAAPQPKIGIVVGAPGNNKLPLALPRATGGQPETKEFMEVLRRDLELSGWFDIIDPAAFIEPAGTGVQPGQFRYEDWEITGSAVLGKTHLEYQDGDRTRAEVWVYDVAGRRKLGAKAFTGRGSDVRMLAHKAANEIILRVTGKPGPFNTRFAVVGQHTGNKEIYVMDFDGANRRNLTQNGSINIQPAWDAAGRRVAFTSYVAGNPDLYVADLTAAKITRLSARKGINTGASFHPRGDRVALTLSPSDNPDIYTIDARSGRTIDRLTRDPGIDVSPAWSPDGSRIAFVSERSGGAQIYVAKADGTGATRVTFHGSYNTDPSWSPDGTQLAFVGRDGNFDVFTVDVDTRKMTRITQGQGDNEDPTWSPDGNYLAFSSTRKGAPHVWMSTADGNHQVQLTQGKGGYTNPAWSPALEW